MSVPPSRRRVRWILRVTAKAVNPGTPVALTRRGAPPYRSRPNDQLPRRGAPTGASAGIEVSTEHWIGGERIGSWGAFADVSPIDESTLAEVARGTAEDADRAVDAARAATETWGRTSPKQRGEVLHRIADLVQERVPEPAPVATRDNGSAVRSMRNSVMPRVARNFRFFADQLTQLRESFEMDGFESRTEWDPSGGTAVITPWNAPLMLAR